MVEEAIFILGPLEELQADLPKLQIAVRATQKESNNGTGDSSNGLEVSVKLLDYLSELRGMGSIPIW